MGWGGISLEDPDLPAGYKRMDENKTVLCTFKSDRVQKGSRSKVSSLISRKISLGLEKTWN